MADHATAELATTPATPALITLAAELNTIVESFRQFEAAKAALLTPNDVLVTRESDGQGGHRSFTKRSGWRKLAIAFRADAAIVEHGITRDDQGRILRSEFVVRAEAPNGRFADGYGACSADERCCAVGCDREHRHCPAATSDRCDPKRHFSKPEHDIPATAETRAKNRAYADLFGMGEVSAEEIDPAAGGSTDRGRPAKARKAKRPTDPGVVDHTAKIRVETQKALASAGVTSGAAEAMTLISAALEALGHPIDTAITNGLADEVRAHITAAIATDPATATTD